MMKKISRRLYQPQPQSNRTVIAIREKKPNFHLLMALKNEFFCGMTPHIEVF